MIAVGVRAEADQFRINFCTARLPDVQAVFVEMRRPVSPKNTPMFTAQVCGMALIYVVAVIPATLFIVSME